MSTHTARVQWSLEGSSFAYEDYSRNHVWGFGESSVQASSAPEYLGQPDLVDPEQALVASISSCHMLTFLAIASRKRLRVESYDDEATGFMTTNEQGRLAITRVELRPRIRFDAKHAVSEQRIESMHELAHKECFIANSVTTEIVVLAPDTV